MKTVPLRAFLPCSGGAQHKLEPPHPMGSMWHLQELTLKVENRWKMYHNFSSPLPPTFFSSCSHASNQRGLA